MPEATTAVFNAAVSKENHEFLGGTALLFMSLQAMVRGYSKEQIMAEIKEAKESVAREKTEQKIA